MVGQADVVLEQQVEEVDSWSGANCWSLWPIHLVRFDFVFSMWPKDLLAIPAASRSVCRPQTL